MNQILFIFKRLAMLRVSAFWLQTLIVVVFTGFMLSTSAQTAIIAHKSHSGTAMAFFIDPSTNFGIPPKRLVQVVYLNDSTVINVYSRYGEDFELDTIHTRTSYSLDIDSIKRQAPHLERVEYVRFKQSTRSSKIKQPGTVIQPEPVKQETNQPEQQQEINPKKKKKSYLLFLFGMTGGGLLLMRLFSKVTRPISA